MPRFTGIFRTMGSRCCRNRAFLDLPVYQIVDRPPGQDARNRKYGEGSTGLFTPRGRVANNVSTRGNWGVELTLSTPRIEAIQTSFNLSASFSNSYYFNRGVISTLPVATPQPNEGKSGSVSIAQQEQKRPGQCHAHLHAPHLPISDC